MIRLLIFWLSEMLLPSSATSVVSVRPRQLTERVWQNLVPQLPSLSCRALQTCSSLLPSGGLLFSRRSNSFTRWVSWGHWGRTLGVVLLLGPMPALMGLVLLLQPSQLFICHTPPQTIDCGSFCSRRWQDLPSKAIQKPTALHPRYRWNQLSIQQAGLTRPLLEPQHVSRSFMSLWSRMKLLLP